jgi:hypothetical protein
MEIPRNDTELVKSFESIGENCEFGFVQRSGGYESPGLFRFNFTVLEKLIAGLNRRFDDLAAPGQVELHWTDEWMVRETMYKFSYHTFNKDRECDLERLLAQQTRWLRYMAEKFIEGVEIGDRIYVRKGDPGEREPEIRSLSESLRRYGPATMLWVTLADEKHPQGTVEIIGDGLIRGWISKFSPHDHAPDIDAACWIELLRRAWALRYLGDAGALPAPAPINLLASNFGGWTGSSIAASEFAWDIPPPRHGVQVMKHVLLDDTSPGARVYGCQITENLVPGDLYVASAEVWFPADFTGRVVTMEILGRPSVIIKRANPKQTGVWQKIWTNARLADDRPIAYPSLFIAGQRGTTFYSVNWQLHRGGIPSGL